MGKIAESLKVIFENERVVFWFDDEEKMREQYEEINLEGVEKIVVANNEFKVKHRVIAGSPKDKLLLYFPLGEKPMEANWLLDLQLAHKVFHTDQEAMFLQELGLDYYFKDLVGSHIEFFQNKDRRQKLKDLLAEDDKEQDIEYKMMAVLFGTEYASLEAFIQSYANAFNDGNERIEKALERFNLKDRFWRDVARKFNYQSDSPAIYDFLLDVFTRNFSLTAAGKSGRESRILVSLWKDAISYQESFKALSDRIANDLNIETLVHQSDYKSIVEEDIFRLIDLKIVHDLIHQIVHESLSANDLQVIIKRRRNKYWYPEYKSLYACLLNAGYLIELVRKKSAIDFGSVEEGAVSYSTELYLIEYHYRKFIYHYRKTNNSVLSSLYEKVNKVYSNDWLLNSNDVWQKTIDKVEQWPTDSKHAQSQFFKLHVQPFIQKKQKVFVVISDALRFENGWELHNEIQAEQRYESDIDYMFTSLPSYTQLGMAALLPHEQLAITADSSVLVDGVSSIGIQGRSKILKDHSGARATAINAEDFMKMNAHTEGRAFAKDNDVIYIYHNHIDSVGDDKTSEVEVFEAVDKEIDYIKELLRKIANVNGSNIMITADHGYLYQHDAIEESDFASSEVKGELWKENRRFVIGKAGLEAGNAVKKFNGSQLGLLSDMDVLIPKSINRLRVKGAGSRFVHGGATLQEIVVPLLRVSKKREDTTKLVDVEIIKSTDKITTNNLAVPFIQKELISEKVLPRQIRAFVKADDDTQLSDIFNFTFSVNEGTERQRATTHVFQMSSIASGKYKNQRVTLVLEEPVSGSSKWKIYQEYYYTLNISFMNDFDDF